MLITLFLISFNFVYNFFEVDIPYGINGILKKRNNEYITIFHEVGLTYAYIIKVEYDNVTFVSEKRTFNRAHYGDKTFNILIIDDNLIFYGLMFSVIVDNNGKTNEILWRYYFLDMIRFAAQAYSNDCLNMIFIYIL